MKKKATKIVKKSVRSTSPPKSVQLGPSQDAQKMALAAAGAGLDKKAIDVEIIDVTGKVDYADFLVLMTGQSDRHVASIAEGVDSALSKLGWQAISVEG
ncbi:MAG TPA: RsfS/YbeB/iojap family protein, partial [Polyangiaceae bacterium]